MIYGPCGLWVVSWKQRTFTKYFHFVFSPHLNLVGRYLFILRWSFISLFVCYFWSTAGGLGTNKGGSSSLLTLPASLAVYTCGLLLTLKPSSNCNKGSKSSKSSNINNNMNNSNINININSGKKKWCSKWNSGNSSNTSIYIYSSKNNNTSNTSKGLFINDVTLFWTWMLRNG